MTSAFLALLALAPLVTPGEPHHEAFRAALAQKAALEQGERELLERERELFAALESALAEAQGETPAALEPPLRALRQVAARLRGQGRQLVRAHEAYLAAADQHQQKLADSPSALRQLAAQFRAFAGEEPFDELQGQYAEFAQSLDALARRSEARHELLAPARDLVAENLTYVRRTALFLDRLDEGLAAVPELSERQNKAALLRQLQPYVSSYERLRRALGTLHGRLTGETSSPAFAAAAMRVSEPPLPFPARSAHRAVASRFVSQRPGPALIIRADAGEPQARLFLPPSPLRRRPGAELGCPERLLFQGQKLQVLRDGQPVGGVTVVGRIRAGEWLLGYDRGTVRTGDALLPAAD